MRFLISAIFVVLLAGCTLPARPPIQATHWNYRDRPPAVPAEEPFVIPLYSSDGWGLINVFFLNAREKPEAHKHQEMPAEVGPQ